MNRKLLVSLMAFIAVLLLPGSVSAHVLIKDQVGGAGAILHVNPDDDPIAGERATLFFDIRDNSINPESSRARLTIIDDQGVAAVASSEVLGSSVSANYVFPRQGLYELKLVITRGDKTIHIFMQSQRVGRGIIGSVTASSALAWAETGIIFTLIAAAFTVIIVFNRREAIKRYSK
ncbi:MAG TPA: hypothetical protein VJ836_00485 [Candidatus Saccharimonadales bacterium]|nr:hypothetical protein [Candidatus Saccharimonadales bacterium]